MIGILDIGNTCTKAAVFSSEGKIVRRQISPEGIFPEAKEFFSGVDFVVIGSVVPSLTALWADFFSGKKLHIASLQSPWGFAIKVEQPETVGVDRLANMEAALSLEGSVLVVDAGTATKFDLLEGVNQRSFPGGAIAPGLKISAEALFARGAQLAPVDLEKHSPVIGYNTETALRSGILHGFASQVDGMILRIFLERNLTSTCSVVATGGNSKYLSGRAKLVTKLKPDFTMEGLHAIAKKL